ncbi:hypothetical protein CFOL_v3_23123 [Cephalotus follicularis]|uniref:P450 domain-containing protein n=1 Tax=Cephalotus follicularis TaxID=3775 RepID=A0A1Q3CHG7_CEPFO|nr:hypothetical protein CFOL_v3_23123 [Cephalotus follicularis]
MDILLQVPTTAMASLLAFAIFVRGLLWMLRGFHKSKSKKRAPPEAGGQWPLIGHLHHLGGPQVAHIVLGSMADKYGPIYTIKHVREYEVKASLKELYQYWGIGGDEEMV